MSVQVPEGYKLTEVGIIPEDWLISNIGSLGNFSKGHGVRKDEATSGELPCIRYGEIYTHHSDIVRTYNSRISLEVAKTSKKLKKGDLLFAGSGETKEEIGKCIAFLEEEEAYAGGDIVILSPNQGSSRFFGYLFNSSIIVQQKASKGQGDAVVHISSTALSTIKIPLPPTKAEQDAIAAALSDADALIESLVQLIEKKRLIIQGTMQELLTGKKRLLGFTEKWKTQLLGDVIDHCSSGATPHRGQPDFYKGNIKWITSGELNYNLITDTIEHISEEAVQKTNLKLHPVGTFLMAITGLEAAGTRGACGIVGSPATTNQSCMAIYPTSELNIEFLYHYYVLRGNELALKYCQGTKQQSYTAKLVKLLPIDLPPTNEEQIGIVSILNDMVETISMLEQKLVKARAVKQGMMQQLLTGRIRLI